MRLALAALLSLVMLAGSAVAQPPTLTPQAGGPVLKDMDQKLSYIIGMNFGSNLKEAPFKIDLDVVARGMKDGVSGAKPLLSPEEMQVVAKQFQEMAMAAEAKEIAAMLAKNKQAGAAFLAENKKRPGVTALPSNLQYEVLKAGAGATPKATDVVTVHYHGTLIDGTVFDSSVTQGKPITMPVANFIQGWIDALQLMKVGDKWRLFVPSDLAYKDEGMPPQIQPGSTLIFEIELLDSKPGAAGR